MARLCKVSFSKHTALIINNINKTKTGDPLVFGTSGSTEYDIYEILNYSDSNDGNQTILTIDNTTVSRDEFQRLYKKNNIEVSFDSASLNEYMQLFIDYKLKVIEAERLGMDTTPVFRNEFGEYNAQLEKPYLTDASVDDSLAREAYEHMQWDIHASHILIRCDENASAADTLAAYKRAQDIRERALKEDFAKLAREVSEDPSASRNGGDLGYFTAFSMIYEFEKMAYATEVGAVSPIFRTRFGYHIIKVADRRPNPGLIRASHIMVRLPQNPNDATEKAAHDKAQMIADSLATGANWSQMVLRYSDDRATKQTDGDLQWFGTGTMVASFEEAAFKMKNIGEISAPVRTEYGWHIIKLTDRRPIESFENLQEQIKRKLSRDIRSQLAQKTVIERLKREYKFTEDKAALDELISRIDTTIWIGNWTADKASGLNKTIFTLADTVRFTQQQYADILANSGPIQKKTPIEIHIKNDYTQLVKQTILSFERKQLPHKYPDFKYLQKEYHDGILIFSLMDKMVWTKASTDSVGLAHFHESNKTHYMWGERVEAVRVNYTGKMDLPSKITPEKLNNTIISAIKNAAKKGNYLPAVKASVNKAGINDSLMVFIVENRILSKGDDANIDGMEWKSGANKVVSTGSSTTLFYIVRTLPPMPKTLDECRGAAIADYQDALEKEWIAQLRTKHTVKIDEKVFNSLIKNK